MLQKIKIAERIKPRTYTCVSSTFRNFVTLPGNPRVFRVPACIATSDKDSDYNCNRRDRRNYVSCGKNKVLLHLLSINKLKRHNENALLSKKLYFTCLYVTNVNSIITMQYYLYMYSITVAGQCRGGNDSKVICCILCKCHSKVTKRKRKWFSDRLDACTVNRIEIFFNFLLFIGLQYL